MVDKSFFTNERTISSSRLIFKKVVCVFEHLSNCFCLNQCNLQRNGGGLEEVIRKWSSTPKIHRKKLMYFYHSTQLVKIERYLSLVGLLILASSHSKLLSANERTGKRSKIACNPEWSRHRHRPEQMMAVCKRWMPLLLVLHSVRTRCILSFFHEWCDRDRVYSFANERVDEAFMPAEF